MSSEERRAREEIARQTLEYPGLANFVSDYGERKDFDWLHYEAVTSGGVTPKFQGEFNTLPAKRILKYLFVSEMWVNACFSAIMRQFYHPHLVIHRLKNDQGDVDVVYRHPFLDYMKGVGDENLAFFIANSIGDLGLTGDAFWWNDPFKKDKIRLPAERVEPIVKDNKIVVYKLVDRNDLGIGPSKVVLEMPPEEITHLKMPNPYSQHIGLSMVIAASLNVLIDKYGKEFIIGYFLRGGNKSGIIETKTKNMDQLIRLAKTIMQAFGGRRNMHADKILPEGATWKSDGSTFNDIKLLEMLAQNVDGFKGSTGCTNTVLGIAKDVNRATAFAEMEHFWLMTVLPMQRIWCTGVEHSPLWEQFKLGPNERLVFDNSNVPYLDDFDRKVEQDVKLVGVISINERRERLGYDEIPRLADKLYVEVEMEARKLGTVGATDQQFDADGNPIPTDGNAEAALDPNLALNGPQITSIMEIIQAVSDAKLPRDSAVALLQTAFAMTEDQAEEILGDVGTPAFTPPPKPEPPLPPGNNPPPGVGGGIDGGDNVDPNAKPEPPNPDGSEEPGDETPTAKSIAIAKEFMHVWKANESMLAEPPQKVWALFKSEFNAWADIVVEHLQNGQAGRTQVHDRAKAFSDKWKRLMGPIALRIYDSQGNQVRASKSFPSVRKETNESRAARLSALRDRAKQVLEDGLGENQVTRFLGYSDTAMDSIYGFIEEELQKGGSLADVATAVRTKFNDSYGLDEAYDGQASTIVQTEYGTAVSMAQAQFGKDIASVSQRMAKFWVSMEDSHTRDSHLAAENETIEGDSDTVMEQEFSATGCRYPRDPSGDASEVINCRCTIQYQVTKWDDEG